MEIQIVIAVIIVALLGYIVFLHIQLSKKNIFIESAFRRLSGIENSRSIDEMRAFLVEIQKIRWFSSFFKDNFFDDNAISFILENDMDLKIYMHYTKEEADAKNILKDGFKFSDSFYKTALPVSKDLLDMKIKHNSRKFFGEYIIIICISNEIVNFYSSELKKAGIKNYSFENILTVATLPSGDNSDQGYQLASPFIKGYIYLHTGEIFKNPCFDPYYNSPAFMKNIELLKGKFSGNKY
jgi:hypothetical protein